MSWNARRASIVLLALIVGVSALCLDSGRAQDKLKEVVKQPAAPPPIGPQPPSNGDAGLNPDGFVTGGISLPKDEKGRGKALEAAVDYIERAVDQSSEEAWATAIETLQKLLKIDEDVYVRLKRTNAEGKTVFVWVSAKQEADRIIGTLPKEGMERYQGKYGDEAAALLKKAKKNGDSTELAKIMKFYAHTEAGGEAIKLLADYHLDRGNYIIAQGCYNKLLNRQGGDKLPAEILAKAWLATRMSPASTTSGSTSLAGSVLTASELSRRLREQGRELKFGEQTIDLSDFEDYAGKLQRPGFDQNATDAIVFRSTPNRANQLVGGPAFMQANRRWRMYYLDSELSDRPLETTAMETMSADEKASPAHDRIEKAKEHLHKNNQPIIPAFSPITVTITKDGRKQPLLVYKNYWGIVARDLKTSEIAWAAPSNWSLQRMLSTKGDTAKAQHLNNWFASYQSQFPQIVLENSTVGTLSTDGQFVYTIEDLAVPPPPNVNFNNGMVFPGGANPNSHYPADLQDAIAHSRLQAFGLGNGGKLTWELGGEEKGPLAGCYFLGPPLPLAGKLYLLVDKQQELRLVCLETIEAPGPDGKLMHVPRVVSSQALGTTQEKMEHDVFRRASAAHLAYGEGILVCPTNAGAVFGINLLENSLVWAYPYREKSDQPQQAQMGGRGGAMIRRGMVVGPNGQPITPLTNHEQRWKASAPVIADGKVVFTAPDAKSLHCINLRDGSPVWRKPKHNDDLYLGNVYNGTVLIVGKKNVRGLSLTSGEVLWTLETGMPSGLGIGSDNVYYLPLKADSKDKKPQIAAIDMDHGTLRPSKSHPRTPGDKDYEVPGNLLFYEGDVISLTADEITVYPQLKRKIADMDAQLAKNPNDPVGLTERGELRLAKNDLAGAIDDLSTALKNNPDAETRERARGKLYDTLTVYVKENFNDAEKYLDEYQELCKLDVDNAPAAKKADLLAEQRRRRANYLWLVGKGREEQGRLVEAFEKYQEFGAEAGKQSELVPAVDERQVKAAPDVWSRGRIIAMMNKATPENRAPLEKLIADKWDKLRETNDLNELRAFVRMFGSVSDAGKEARLQLVERLMEQKDSADAHPLLEAELELNQFRTGRHAPELAARATEALARLYIHKGLLEDAAYCYRKLGGEFAKVLIRDGKTGKQIYDDDAATDKRLIPYLDDPQPLGSVKFKGKKETPAPGTTFADLQPGGPQYFHFEHQGEKLPFFRRHLIGISTAGSNQESFKLFDRRLEDEKTGAPREVFSRKLTPSGFQVLATSLLGNQVNPNLPTTASARFPYQTMGHLIVLTAGHMVYGIDPVNHRVLWDANLMGGGAGPEAVNPQNPNAPVRDPQKPALVDPRDGSVLVAYANNWAQRLGQAGSLQGQAICVQTREALTALDPLTGRSLWTRMDVNPRNYLFADEEHVFVVELSDANVPHATRVFRTTDGITVKAPDFSALFQRRLQVFGRHLLLSEAGPGNGVLVRLYDVLTGEDVWKQNYAARSLVARSEDPSRTAIVEPDGKVHVIDLAARKEVMAGQMEKEELAKHLRNVQIVHLLADRDYFYLACQAPMEANNNNRMGGGIQSSVMTQQGMRTIPVNGYIYAFPRDSKGDYEWFAEVKNQFLLLDQFQDLPLLMLTARQQVAQNQPGRPWTPQISVTSIEKRRGSTVFFDEKLPQNTSNFFAVRVDTRARTVELLGQNTKIVHYPDTGAKDKAARDARPAADAPAPPQSQPAPAKGIGGNIKRAPVDRVRIREIAPPLPPR